MNGPKLERPLFIDMDFGEALQRFVQTKPDEVQAPPKRSGKKAGGAGERATANQGSDQEKTGGGACAADSHQQTHDAKGSGEGRTKGGVRQGPKGSTDAG